MSEARSSDTPWEENTHVRVSATPHGERSTRLVKECCLRSAEAVLGVMKRLVPRSSLEEPRLHEAPTR